MSLYMLDTYQAMETQSSTWFPLLQTRLKIMKDTESKGELKKSEDQE